MNEDFVIGIRFSWSVTLLFFWHDRIVCEDQKYALLFCHICDYLAPELSHNYRLMHALFQIKTVIIPRDRYRPEGFSPRVDIGRGMTTVLTLYGKRHALICLSHISTLN
jgi:hypothetical protein